MTNGPSRFEKCFGIVGLVGVLGFFSLPAVISHGYKESATYRELHTYVTGTVLKEYGTITDKRKSFERSEGALFENDSVKIGNSYALQFRTDNDGKIYNFAVNESYQHKLEVLNMAIEEGTRVRMTKWDFQRNLNGSVGCIDDYKLEVLEK